MKRILSFALAAAMLLCLCACGGGGDTQEQNALTKDMLVGKTFSSGRLGVTAEQDPEFSITFEKDGVVAVPDSYHDVYWTISDGRVLFSAPIVDCSSYLYRDGYLLAESSCVASNGMIPDGDTFNASVTVLHPFFGGKLILRFAQDGTCTATDEAEQADGLYKREGDLIKLYNTNSYGEQVIEMYLYYAGENAIYAWVLFPEE